MIQFIKPSVLELSILRRVDGCLWANAIKAGRMPIYTFILLKVPHLSDSAAKDTTIWIVLHSMWIGPFLLGVGFIGLDDGQSLKYKCPGQQLLASGMARYAASESTYRTMLMSL